LRFCRWKNSTEGITVSKKQNNREPEKETPKSFIEKAKAFFKELAIVLGLFVLINSFVVASFLVPTGSMEDEVLTGELLFVNKFLYGPTTPRTVPLTGIDLGIIRIPPVPIPWFRLPVIRDVRRGDVIVFEFPGYRDELISSEFQFYLKRCVGVPGDTIQIRERVLYVNGALFPLPRHVRFDRPWSVPTEQSEDQIFPKGAPWNADTYGPLVVPYSGMTVPLTPESLERWGTFIRREGHAVTLVGSSVLVDGIPTTSYTVRRDYLFGMGDHRDNSLDSRYWGFIPKDNLVGTPIVVYWSWNTDLPLYDIFGRIASVRWSRIGSLIK
jgi:signal peptidase I